MTSNNTRNSLMGYTKKFESKFVHTHENVTSDYTCLLICLHFQLVSKCKDPEIIGTIFDEIAKQCSCAPGWKGILCSERDWIVDVDCKKDCSVNQGGCGPKQVCLVSLINKKPWTECACIPGYLRVDYYTCKGHTYAHRLIGQSNYTK
ncbi:hypothetical protein HELRODRAFT_167120 [Helobdella robusta]|uniref:EGF-like domain-containing protein n=1 Tax=Helobdella robusta TaxID=6412 RepID=T1EZ18_HELRO|nr:hypothetical protein HELRODRAFT_167120 [Helobdella robusta]ESO10614.1 hypothetical protein HELRODRAFT_167120 [Helobdella robusta]